MRIGRNFGQELQAAGLTGGWNSETGEMNLFDYRDAEGRGISLRKLEDGSVEEARLEGEGGPMEISEPIIAALKAALTAHDPAPIAFGGEEVASAADVDRVTARRIRELLAPDWKGDAQMSSQAMLRLVEELLAAVYVIEYKTDATLQEKDAARLLLDANWQMREDQLRVLRQEGADFKAARGW